MDTGPLSALKRAIEIKQSAAALADAVKPLVLQRGFSCSQQHVFNWLNRDGGVSAHYVLAVSEAVCFQVTPHELRPDIYPHPHDGLPAEKRAAA